MTAVGLLLASCIL